MNDWKAEFMAKLLGMCWHEWDRYETDIDGIEFRYCSCGVRTLKNCSNTPYPLHTAQYNPFTGSRLSYDTIDKIVEQMPEVWDKYLRQTAYEIWEREENATMVVNAQLQADNFLQYLYDHQEWGLIKCPIAQWNPDRQKCNNCNLTGTIKSPALLMLIKGMEGE